MTLAVMRSPATSTEDRAERGAEKDFSEMRTQVVTAPTGKVCAEKLDLIVRAGKALGWVVEFFTSSTSSASRQLPRDNGYEIGNRIAAFSNLVDDMKDLHDDWNGYGSDAPGDFAREVAKQILLTATNVVEPTRVTPSAQGGVGICFTFKGKDADMECLNAGEILATTSDGKALPDVWEVKPGDIKEALERIARFLHS